MRGKIVFHFLIHTRGIRFKIKENFRTLSRIPIGTIASTLTVSQWDDVCMSVTVMKVVKIIVWLDLRIGSSIVLVR